MKALECPQHYTLIFKRSRAANSVVGDVIWQKFKLRQALWLSLLPARMNKIQSKMKALESSQHFSHYKSMENFSDVQR